MTQRIYEDTLEADRTVCDSPVLVRCCVLVDSFPATRWEPGDMDIIEVNLFWPDGRDVPEAQMRIWDDVGIVNQLVDETISQGKWEEA